MGSVVSKKKHRRVGSNALPTSYRKASPHSMHHPSIPVSSLAFLWHYATNLLSPSCLQHTCSYNFLNIIAIAIITKRPIWVPPTRRSPLSRIRSPITSYSLLLVLHRTPQTGWLARLFSYYIVRQGSDEVADMHKLMSVTWGGFTSVGISRNTQPHMYLDS